MKKISELPAATTPLGGTELLEIVQGGASKSVEVAELGGGGGGLDNWIDTLHTAAPNATNNVAALAVTGGTSSVFAALTPKNGGGVLAQRPDNGTGGGAVRGFYCVDWQTSRTGSAQVASGIYSTVGGGRANSATGESSTASGGFLNSATALNAAVSGGRENAASGAYSHIPGGWSNTADGPYSMASGWRATTRGIHGAEARASGMNTAQGDAQRRTLTLRKFIGGDAQTPLTTNGNDGGASTTNQLVLPNNSAFVVTGRVIGREASSGDAKAWTFSCAIKRGANAAATSMIAACTPVLIAEDAGASSWALAVEADTTNGALAIKVTGESGKSLKWAATIDSTEVVG